LHGLAHDDAGRLRFDLAGVRRGDLAQAVDGLAERVHSTSHELGPDRHLEYARRAADLVALLELEEVAENDGSDVVFLEVERESGDLVLRLGRGDLEHLAGHRLLEPVDASDAVLDLEHGADVLDVELVQVGSLDFTEQDVFDLARAQGGVGSHTEWSGSPGYGPNEGSVGACEKYHKPQGRGKSA